MNTKEQNKILFETFNKHFKPLVEEIVNLGYNGSITVEIKDPNNNLLLRSLGELKKEDKQND